MLVCLELCLCLSQLASHLIIPLLDSIEHACVLIILVLPDLLLSLPNLLFFELGELAVVPSKLFKFMVSLSRVLFIDAVTIRAIMG